MMGHFFQILPPSQNIWTLAVLTHHQSFLNVIDILQLFLSSHMYVKSQGSITLLKRNLKYKCRWWLDHESFIFYSYVLWPLKRKPKQDRIRKCRKIKYIPICSLVLHIFSKVNLLLSKSKNHRRGESPTQKKVSKSVQWLQRKLYIYAQNCNY